MTTAITRDLEDQRRFRGTCLYRFCRCSAVRGHLYCEQHVWRHTVAGPVLRTRHNEPIAPGWGW